MSLALLILANMAQANIPPVPGLCSAPVPVDRETPGCYKTGEISLADAPRSLFWSIYETPDLTSAKQLAKPRRWASVAQAHSRTWLYLLDERPEKMRDARLKAVIGPLALPKGAVTAHFAEAIFPPGMQTRVHSHPGPEAFYVVEGQQCMESPTSKKVISAGGTYVVESGPHLQAAPRGRRNLVLILAPAGMPAVTPGGNWVPTGYCAKSAQQGDSAE